MGSLFKAAFLGVGVLLLLVSAEDYCTRERFGRRETFSCPEPGDNPRDQYCCGVFDEHCCSVDMGMAHVDYWTGKLTTFIGIGVGLLVLMVALCIGCCCCCPFCLLYKRRNPGVVQNPNPQVVMMQPHVPPSQQQVAYNTQPVQAGYPAQPTYPPQAGYPPQPDQSTPCLGEQPPMYTEKQLL